MHIFQQEGLFDDAHIQYAQPCPDLSVYSDKYLNYYVKVIVSVQTATQ